MDLANTGKCEDGVLCERGIALVNASKVLMRVHPRMGLSHLNILYSKSH